jgi:cytochrome b561
LEWAGQVISVRARRRYGRQERKFERETGIMSKAVTRYHPLIVALHWLLGLLIVGNIAGGLWAHSLPNDAGKLWLLRAHMLGGVSILALIVLRLVVRLTTAKPPVPHASKGLRALTLANHWGLYLLTLAMVSTGLGTAAATNLFPLLGGEPVTLPATFETAQPFAGHELFWKLLLALVALHVAAVVWHRVARGENIVARMWFGPRETAAAERQPA